MANAIYFLWPVRGERRVIRGGVRPGEGGQVLIKFHQNTYSKCMKTNENEGSGRLSTLRVLQFQELWSRRLKQAVGAPVVHRDDPGFGQEGVVHATGEVQPF